MPFVGYSKLFPIVVEEIKTIFLHEDIKLSPQWTELIIETFVKKNLFQISVYNGEISYTCVTETFLCCFKIFKKVGKLSDNMSWMKKRQMIKSVFKLAKATQNTSVNLYKVHRVSEETLYILCEKMIRGDDVFTQHSRINNSFIIYSVWQECVERHINHTST